MKKKGKDATAKLLLNMLLILLSVSILLPVVYMVSVAFGKNVLTLGQDILPRQFTLQNFEDLFTKHKFLVWMKNSLIISFGTMAASVVLTSMGAYALSRLRFAGRDITYRLIILIQIFPLTLSMVAIHQILNALGLLNNLLSLIIINTVLSTTGMLPLAKGYFATIPTELDESARIDGAGKVRVLVSIILPLVKPMLATIAIQSFILAYNEYVIANIVMTGGFMSMPLAVGLQSMFEGQYGIHWPSYCAAALLGSLPMLAVFFLLQKYFISGLTDGSVKQ
jgi:arabinogalactan oligomer/maltooligosaccharide transport system permease protein